MQNNASFRTGGYWSMGAIMRDLATAMRMIWNPNVPLALKVLLPLAALVYWISPIDLLPFIPLDDVAIMLLALRLFAQMAPPAAERRTAGRTHSQADEQRTDPQSDHDVIDTTWRVIE